jgi:hypothetical protein
VGSFSLGDGTFDSNMVGLTIIISTLPLGFKIVSIVLWVGKFLGCCEGSCACCGGGGSGGFCSTLTWLALVPLGAGYVICGIAGW